MILWRIAAETRAYQSTDLSGAGAAKNPGRWNAVGQPMIYAAQAPSLAVLETAAHIDSTGLPLNRYLIKINIPDEIWAHRESVDATHLPPAWAAIPAGVASVQVGSDWLQSLRSLILVVPSAIIPEECASLLNPLHDLMKNVTAEAVRPFEYNRLFR